MKSRSRSKKDKKSHTKDAPTLDLKEVKTKASYNNHRKSSSTKTIHYKVLTYKKEPLKQSKTNLQNQKSKISRKSDKSQLHSKITADEPGASKSTTFLRNTLRSNVGKA